MKGKKFIIYIIVLGILLVCIMFILPDSFFERRFNNIKIPTPEVEKKEFVDFEIQKEHLLNNKYNYSYDLLDSIGENSVILKCTGIVNGNVETGECTLPKEISYTDKNKKEVLKDIEVSYVDAKYILDIIKDLEPVKTQKESSRRELYYNIQIGDLETELTVITDLEEITQIEISNAYMTYVIKYSNIIY